MIWPFSSQSSASPPRPLVIVLAHGQMVAVFPTIEDSNRVKWEDDSLAVQLSQSDGPDKIGSAVIECLERFRRDRRYLRPRNLDKDKVTPRTRELLGVGEKASFWRKVRYVQVGRDGEDVEIRASRRGEIFTDTFKAKTSIDRPEEIGHFVLEAIEKSTT